MSKIKSKKVIEPEVYIVVLNHENMEISIHYGELVESNLIEVGNRVTSYAFDEQTPEFLKMLDPHRAAKGESHGWKTVTRQSA